MTRVISAFLLAAACALSTPIVLAAQRGGGGGHSQGVPAAGRMGGGFGAGKVGGMPGPGRIGDGHVVQPTPSPISISRPIGNNISSVNPTPSLGFGFFVPRSPLDTAPGFGPFVPRSRFHTAVGVGAFGPRSPFDARPGTYTHPSGYFQQYPAYSYGAPYDYGYGAGPYDTYAGMQPLVREQEMVNGVLYVDVTPANAMVFVDTVYVGSADDVLANGVTLSRGRHWLEIDAPEYDKNLTEINISPGQPLRYRVDLTPVRRAAPVVTPPRPPQTMYAIPGCYGGNRPPVVANLPPGCDIAKVRVIRPQRAN